MHQNSKFHMEEIWLEERECMSFQLWESEGWDTSWKLETQVEKKRVDGGFN